MRYFFIMSLLSLMAGLANAQETPVVTIETNVGNIVLELDPAGSPKTVKNFLVYVEENTYANTIFHRVIKGFMIQGGGYTKDYREKSTHAPVKNESDNGLKNLRGTIAMARTNDPHSATSQFFINVADNTFLDYRKPANWGYTVFGKVTEGMDVVDKIENVSTGSGGPFPKDVPQTPIVIEKITVAQRKTTETQAVETPATETAQTPSAEEETKKKVTTEPTTTKKSTVPPDAPTDPDKPEPLPH